MSCRTDQATTSSRSGTVIGGCACTLPGLVCLTDTRRTSQPGVLEGLGQAASAPRRPISMGQRTLGPGPPGRGGTTMPWFDHSRHRAVAACIAAALLLAGTSCGDDGEASPASTTTTEASTSSTE